MKERHKIFLRKASFLFLVALIVLGFTVPGFINPTDSPDKQNVEPRLCQTDSECYLTCDDLPVKVMCSGNICQQNSCDGYSLSPFRAVPITYSLKVLDFDLSKRVKQGDYFIQFSKDIVKQNTIGLSLPQVLEKASMQLTDGCLYVGDLSYCTGEEGVLSVTANDEPSTPGYYPQEGDVVVITYQ